MTPARHHTRHKPPQPKGHPPTVKGQPTHPVTRNVMRNLRAYRTARGHSVQKIADQMTERGVAIERTVLANFESGRRQNISIAEVTALADVLGVTINDLIDDNGPCTTCYGSPPEGFICRSCGTETHRLTPPAPGNP